jgi:hypothetical protein
MTRGYTTGGPRVNKAQVAVFVALSNIEVSAMWPLTFVHTRQNRGFHVARAQRHQIGIWNRLDAFRAPPSTTNRSGPQRRDR